MQTILLLAVAIAIAPLLSTTHAGARELRSFGGGHFQGSGQPIATRSEKKTGIATSFTPGNTGPDGEAVYRNRGLEAIPQITTDNPYL